jgi:hypothetical protein
LSCRVNARDFLKRVEQLAGTINDVFIVLSGIFGQPEKYQQFTDAEKIIWKRMEDILHLCKQHLEDLHQQLEVVAAKTEGFINRTKEAAKLSLLIPVIKRTKDDINLYFNALNLLKGLLQMWVSCARCDMLVLISVAALLQIDSTLNNRPCIETSSKSETTTGTSWTRFLRAYPRSGRTSSVAHLTMLNPIRHTAIVTFAQRVTKRKASALSSRKFLS